MKKIFGFILLLIICTAVNAQVKMTTELEQRLAGKTKFYDIQKSVEQFYAEEKGKLALTDSTGLKKINRQLKMWNRLFYDAASHLNSNGEVENATQRIFDVLTTMNPEESTAFGDWEPIGPNLVNDGIGRVSRIAFHPTDANTIYIGTPRGGLWKTLNGGNNWGCISNYIPSLGISGIVVDQTTPQTLYVLTGDGDANIGGGGLVQGYGYLGYSVGVLKSTDGGATWFKTGNFPVNPARLYTGYNLVQSPVDPNLLLVATSCGLFKTTDGGTNWTMADVLNPGAADDTARVWDVTFRPGSATIAYCTISQNTGSRFLRSADGGSSFLFSSTVNFSPNTFNTGAQRIRIGVTSTGSNNIVYLLAGPGNVNAQTFKGIWRSADAGQNFTLQTSTPDILGYSDIINDFNDQNTYDLALAVHPTITSRIATGGLVVWRSTNSGVNMSEIVDYFADADNSNYIHPDVHDLRYNPLDGKLWAASDGGISVSSDNGDNWVRKFNDLQISAFYHFEPEDENGYRWGGTQDCGTLVQASGGVYDHFDGGDGYDVMTDKAPAGNNNDSYWVINTSIWTDGVADINITPPGSNNFFPNLDMSPNNEDIIYAGYQSLYVSLDRGDNWATVLCSNCMGAGSFFVPGNWCVATCPSNPARVYAAGAVDSDIFGLCKITSANTASPAATRIFGPAQGLSSSQKITDITVDPSNSNHVWITIGGFTNNFKVFYTGDAGSTWTNMSGNLPNLPVNCILLAGDDVYIGTDIGVYYRNSSSTGWTPFFNGLPRVPVTEMYFVTRVLGNIATDYIEASTFGRGLWRTEPFSACVAILNISEYLQGQKFMQAGAIISATSAIGGGAGTNVNFQAGSYIYLEPGFHVEAGSEFDTKLAPCNSGVPGKIAPDEKYEMNPRLLNRKNIRKVKGRAALR